MGKVLRTTLIFLGFTLLTICSFGQNNNKIQGQVLYNYTTPIDDVNAYLADASGNIISTTTTNTAGHYHFNNLPAGTYTVTFSTEVTPGGVTLSDGYLVMLYLTNPNLYPLTSFQLMLADVNNDGSVTIEDYNEIVYSYLNQGNPMSGGEWDFESYTTTLGGGGRSAFVTAGGSNGDVNGTFLPPKFGNCYISDNLSETIVANIPEEKSLDLVSDQFQEISGMHLIFTIPEGIALQKVTSCLPGMHVSQSGNEVRMTWMSADLSCLRIEEAKSFVDFQISAMSNVVPDQLYQLTLNGESHFIGKSGEMLPYVNLSLPGLLFKSQQSIALNEIVYPNPFMEYTTLDYTLPSDGDVKIIVTNSAGQVILVAADEFQAAGRHSTKINGSDWPSGIYPYAIFLKGNISAIRTGTMIKSR